ncbi:Hypothetical_protein [Hexamita inflata]|uniref:Hypothetical_protein n=1 Tax=Hexamita inflata TaxID=28002 RepID=A0ABP1IJZ5_9EUKA
MSPPNQNWSVGVVERKFITCGFVTFPKTMLIKLNQTILLFTLMNKNEDKLPGLQLLGVTVMFLKSTVLELINTAPNAIYPRVIQLPRIQQFVTLNTPLMLSISSIAPQDALLVSKFKQKLLTTVLIDLNCSKYILQLAFTVSVEPILDNIFTFVSVSVVLGVKRDPDPTTCVPIYILTCEKSFQDQNNGQIVDEQTLSSIFKKAFVTTQAVGNTKPLEKSDLLTTFVTAYMSKDVEKVYQLHSTVNYISQQLIFNIISQIIVLFVKYNILELYMSQDQLID